MRRTTLVLLLFLLTVACDTSRPPARTSVPPPPGEFLLATLDSTFWVRSAAGTIRAHGVPLLLASYDGRFYEIFVADDDRSYDDALLVGQRLYRRDLVAGDSVVLFADTIVPRIAGLYARAHPRERPLEPDEDVRENPRTRATAEVDVLDVHGPYLSFQYHADVAEPGGNPWHTTRRGVLDLRSGRALRVTDLFSDSVAARVVRAGRLEFLAAVDSLRERVGRGDSRAGRAADALGRFAFDERSFALAALDSIPAVEFAPTGRGSEESEDLPSFGAVPAGDTPWWHDVRSSLPATEVPGDVDRWRPTTASANRQGQDYDVLARYDSLGETARILISDRRRREWPVASVMAPVQRIFWLDHTPIDSAQRRGLLRAFSEASLYDETTRSVRDEHRTRDTRVLITASRARITPRRSTASARTPRVLPTLARTRS